ncbi:MAG: hypoxanthine phosphoribosyltransferase [Fimbriimonadaceae bacterium]|nr:hypoxanthine phosphoribosyltransferase [Alphaproteobacteria bacterium]
MLIDDKPGFRIKTLFDAKTIAKRNKELAREIVNSGMDKLLVVAVLKGSFVFTADLLRALYTAKLSPEVDFISLSSYRAGLQSSGEVEILRDVETDVQGRNILLVDDILESGRTLAFAKDLFSARGAKRIATCVLLDKPNRRAVDITADFSGFECPDVFVVGYGMDMAHSFRELPFVGVVERDKDEQA